MLRQAYKAEFHSENITVQQFMTLYEGKFDGSFRDILQFKYCVALKIVLRAGDMAVSIVCLSNRDYNQSST